MERELVTEEELIAILNKELRKYEEYNDCQFESMLILKGYDPSGCNWSSTKVRCSGIPAEVCEPITSRIVADAMKKYNIKK